MSTEYRDYRIATGSNIDIFAKLPEVNITDSFIDEERKELFRSTEESVKAIKEHQNLCKKVIEISNMTDSQMIAEFDQVFEAYRTRNDIINELRSDLKHINLDQYAGKTREIMEKLTKLVAL